MRPAPRIPKVMPKPKRQPNDRRDRQHRKFVASLPCLACGTSPSVAAHIRFGMDGGTGMKPSDRHCVPLCTICHERQHKKGEPAFWAEIGMDPSIYSARLWAISGDSEQGLRVVMRARQSAAMRQTNG